MRSDPTPSNNHVEGHRFSNGNYRCFTGSVALSIQPSSALRSLTLQPKGGISPACVAKLSSLCGLTSMSTDLGTPVYESIPMDLAEYANFTGAIPRLISSFHKDLSCCCARAMCQVAVTLIIDCCRRAAGLACTGAFGGFTPTIENQMCSCPASGAPSSTSQSCICQAGEVSIRKVAHRQELCTSCSST